MDQALSSGEAFGGSAVFTFADGTILEDEIAVADAHPLGARPFGRAEYTDKFHRLADGVMTEDEQERFLSLAQLLPTLSPEEVDGLNLRVPGLEEADSRRRPVLMFHSPTTAGEKRQALRDGLASGRLMRFPGAFNPLSAMLIERSVSRGSTSLGPSSPPRSASRTSGSPLLARSPPGATRSLAPPACPPSSTRILALASP